MSGPTNATYGLVFAVERDASVHAVPAVRRPRVGRGADAHRAMTRFAVCGLEWSDEGAEIPAAERRLCDVCAQLIAEGLP